MKDYNVYTSFEVICANLVNSKYNLSITPEEMAKYNFNSTRECMIYFDAIYKDEVKENE